MKCIKIVYKKHAVEMMTERGITRTQVEFAIKRGCKFKQTDGFLARYSYFAVAYKIVGKNYIIKTVYVD
ncbi:DUF4258 domain-containing protein [Candidatus Woesearchaeota archaeon]|jgi:hypothetical protein|nr:DUF4258 domain-containing protein [Candidatus Woesearchaeota archaeon]MBT6518891.1 DUF4258 domain-containing protein [Candidatus Woesearchaeota archaeon]MBT7368493.1 DUF4258 domain-containing protein [Candidatus Woesearchaeota archaeon]